MRKKLKSVIAAMMITMINCSIAYGAEDVSWQVNNAAILENNSIINSAIRYVGWQITKLVVYVADICEELYNKTFGLIDITNYPSLNGIIDSLKPVLVAVTVLCVIGLGISYMVMQDRKPVIRNVLIAALVISSSTYAFTMANSLVKSFRDAMLTTTHTAQSYVIVNDNMIDLVGVDKAGGITALNYNAGTGIVHNAGITNSSSFNDVDYNSVLNWDDKSEGQSLYGWSDTFNKYLTYKAVKVMGEYKSAKVYDGVLNTTIGNEFYYRYNFDFWSANLQLLALILIFLSLAYKNVRIAYELMVGRVMAYMYSADVTNGERLKSIIFYIRDTYIVLCISILCIRLYEIINEALPTLGINGLAKGIVSVFVAFAVIDGPNIVERVLGIDAGLSSSFGRTMAMFGMAKSGMKSIKKGASGLSKGAMAAATGKTKAQRKAANGQASAMEKMALAGRKKLSNTGTSKSTNTASKGYENSKSTESTGIGMLGTNQKQRNDEQNGNTERKPNISMPSGTMSNSNKSIMSGAASGYVSAKSISAARSNRISRNGVTQSGYNSNFMNQRATTAASNAASVSARNVRAGAPVAKVSYSGKPYTPSASGRGQSIGKTSLPSGGYANLDTSNMTFKEAVSRLAPPHNASIGERKDFNRQVSEIVRGSHQAIKPSTKSRAAYKKTNYEKGQILAEVYEKNAKSVKSAKTTSKKEGDK